MNHIRARTNIILLAICLIGWIPASAYAQNKNITAEEKTVLAFYSLSGLAPDFDKWIRTAHNADKSNNPLPHDLIEQEKLRLQYGLGTYDREREILKINTAVIGQLISKDETLYLASHFEGESALEAPYFPYNAGHIWVAVILNDLEKYLLLELDEEHKQKISMLLPEHNTAHDLKLDIFFRPTDAQAEPIQMDGVEQHIMLGEIAYIGFKKPGLAGQQNDSILWEYYAPWYMDAEEQDLLDILESR